MVHQVSKKSKSSSRIAYFRVGKYSAEIISGGRSRRAKMERVCDLERRVHGQSFREVSSCALEYEVGQMCPCSEGDASAAGAF